MHALFLLLLFAVQIYGQRSQSGLRNHGNTCYLNSATQIMYFLPAFREKVLELEDSSLTGVGQSYKALLQAMKAGNGVVDAEGLAYTQALNAITGNTFTQRDVQEYIINDFPNVGPAISDIYSELHTSKIQRLNKAATKSWYSQDELQTELILQTRPTLMESIKFYFQDEPRILDDPDNPAVKLNVISSISFKEFPKVLPLIFTRKDMTNVDYSPVRFPQTINLKDYNGGKDMKYYLYGLSHHAGGFSGGHYTSYIRQDLDFFEPETKVKFVEYNDNVVTPLSHSVFDDNIFSHATSLHYIREDMIPVMFGIAIPKPDIADFEWDDWMIVAVAVGSAVGFSVLLLISIIVIRKRNKKHASANVPMKSFVKV